MKTNLKLYLLVLFTSMGMTSYAQETIPINASMVLKLAHAGSLTVKQYELQYKQALADEVRAGEWWMPVLKGGISAHYLNGAALNTDGRLYTHIAQNSSGAGIGFLAEIDLNKGRYEYLASIQRSKASRFSSDAQRNQFILKAIQTYYDLQAAQYNFRLLSELSEQAALLTRELKIQADAGLRYQSEYLLASTSEQQFRMQALQSENEASRLSAALVNMLSLGTGKRLVSSDTLLLAVRLSSDLSLEKSSDSGYMDRPEFKGLQASLQGFQSERKISASGSLLPKIIIGTDDGLFGHFSNPTFNTYQLNAGLVWTLPLGRLFKHGELQQQDTRIATAKNGLELFRQQYETETLDARSQIRITAEIMKLSAGASAMAKEALSQSLGRQQIGTAKAFEVIQAEQVYFQVKLDQAQAITTYNKEQYAFLVALGVPL